MHLGSFSATSEPSTASGYSPLRMGLDSQFDLVVMHLLLQEGVMSIFDEFNSRRERDIHSPVKILSFLKMTPCLYTGVQHERI